MAYRRADDDENEDREKCQRSKNMRGAQQIHSYYVWIHLSHVNLRVHSAPVFTFYLLSFWAKHPTLAIEAKGERE